jgi:hypothetical protein
LDRRQDGPKVATGHRTLVKSIAATAGVAMVLAAAALYSSGYVPWPSARSGDSVTQQETAAREAAFSSQPALALSMVSPDDVVPAVDQMGLPAPEKAALLARLNADQPALSPGQKPETVAPATLSAAAPAPAHARTRLAWITLWDTDAEDGDVVRIESNGLSRTITLSKQPLTIAVPVPADSVVKVSGVRDGEGGGITVGFASGAARAVFPIMSVGQTLGLRVRFN